MRVKTFSQMIFWACVALVLILLPFVAKSQTVEAQFPSNQFSVICTKESPKSGVYNVQISYGKSVVFHSCSTADVETIDINCHQDVMTTVKTVQGATIELIGTRDAKTEKIGYNGFNFKFGQIDLSSVLPPTKILTGKQFQFTFTSNGVWIKNLTRFNNGLDARPVFYKIVQRDLKFVKLEEDKLLYWDGTYYLYEHPGQADSSGNFQTSEKYVETGR